MAEKALDAPEEQPDQPAPDAVEKFYRIVPFQMSRDDGSGCFWAGEVHPASEFPTELDRLIELGALVLVE